MIRSSGNGSPITPVEATNTRPGWQPRRSATAFAVRLAAAMPAAPVKALALPALTRIARAFPPARLARQISTGAAAVSDRVKTPATVVPAANSRRQTSVRPWYRTPQARAASRTPAIGGSSGMTSGARGERGGMAASKSTSRDDAPR